MQAVTEMVVAQSRRASSRGLGAMLSHSLSLHDSDLLVANPQECTILLVFMLDHLVSMLNSFLLVVLEGSPRNLSAGILGQAFLMDVCSRPSAFCLQFVGCYSWADVYLQVHKPIVWREAEL